MDDGAHPDGGAAVGGGALSNDRPAVDEAARLDGAAAHVTALHERGAFCSASCACGWRGAARRARDRARADALAHQDAHRDPAPHTAAPPPGGPAGAL
ncbi:hypothetical protein ABZ820_11455 [Streptomyces diacarni]|uniref:hypothetical protein n=1 Tax=Streptomyces diacarni TaxID=2800381 RepID=UPI0033FD540B